MALHLLHLILITITTRMTNYACGELFLKMPLTINPVVQDAITVRSGILEHFYNDDPEFFSRLTPADMVVMLNNSLSFVMRKKIVGAVVLGVAAKSAGLHLDQFKHSSFDNWSVNVSLTEIKSVLRNDETHYLPLSDNITMTALQNVGLRVIQKRYNVSLRNITEPLHSSAATTFESILEDWVSVVRFITKTNIERLAARYQVSVPTLAQALKSTSKELYGMTLDQLDMVLSTNFKFVEGSFEVVVPTAKSSTAKSSTAKSSTAKSSTAVNSSTSHQITGKTTSLPSSTADFNLRTLQVSRSTAGSSSEEKITDNLALFVGVPAGLLLILVASSTVWCFRRKRRQSGRPTKEKKKPKNHNDIKMNNFWIDKNDNELSSNQDEARQEELVHHIRRPSTGYIAGGDSRFKGLKYAPTSCTFSTNAPLKITNSRFDFENDTRREIFV